MVLPLKRSSSRTSRSSRQPPGGGEQSSLPWQDKHRPRDVKSVAAHTMKKRAVREWLLKTKEKALYQMSLGNKSLNYKPSVLIMCGCSGCCKSTLVEITAKDLGIPIVEWHDDLLESQSEVYFNPFLNQEFTEENDFPLSMKEEVDDFALHSSYAPLRCTSRRNSTLHRSHSTATTSSMSSDSSLFEHETSEKRRKIIHSHPQLNKQDGDEIDDFDDECFVTNTTQQSFGFPHALHRSDSMRSNASVTGCSNYGDDEVTCGGASTSHHVTLIHGPASLAPEYSNKTYETSESWRSSQNSGGIYRQLMQFRHPVVLILSGISDRDAMFWAINELIPQELQSSFDLEVLFCTPITTLSTMKVLRQISDNERTSGLRNLPAISDHVLESIALSSQGDLRQAINQLQMHMLGDQNVKTKSTDIIDGDMAGIEYEKESRDKSYSFLRGVAKLIWAELTTEENLLAENEVNCSSKLLYKMKFRPDDVVTSFELPLDITMSFLQHNYLEIMQQKEAKYCSNASSNLKEDSPKLPIPTYDTLERAERFSDLISEADMLYTCQFSTNLPLDRAQGSSFPKEYVESICSRAAACSMYATSKTAMIFDAYNNLNHERTDGYLRPVFEKKNKISSGTASMVTADSGNNFKGSFVPINRPTVLDTVRKAHSIATLTRDLRTALVSQPVVTTQFQLLPSPVKPTSSRFQSNALFPENRKAEESRDGYVNGCTKNLQSFDFVQKEVAKLNTLPKNPASNKCSGLLKEGSLPVSFLSSTELITVVVPYLKYFRAMSGNGNSEQTSFACLHPNILKHVSVLMGSIPREDIAVNEKATILIGRNQHDLFGAKSEEGNICNNSSDCEVHKDADIRLDDEVEEFSD